MKRADSIKELEKLKISTTPSDDGNLTDAQLELMVQDAKAKNLETQLNKAKKEKSETAEELQKANKMILDLNEQLSSSENGKRSKNRPTFKVKKETYELVMANSTAIFEKNRVAVNAETLAANPALVEHLVKIQAGCLKLVKS